MKSIIQYVNEVQCDNMLATIDNEIMNEKLQEPHLIEIAKWLRQFGSKHDNWYGNQSFSGVFGQWNIKWDEVTTADFDTYEAGDKAGIKAAIATQKQGDSFSNNLVLFLNENDKIFAIVTCYGIKALNTDKTRQEHPKKKVKTSYGSEYETTDWDSWEEVNVKPDNNFCTILQKQVREMCQKYKFMVLDINSDKLKSTNKIWQRRKDKEGIISPDMYYKIAQENRERYKKIIAKNKAEHIAKNDTLSQDVNDIVTKVLNLTQKIMQGGAKYADLDWRVQSLLESCYGKRVYTGDRRFGRSGYEGSDGLLTMFANYVSTNMRAAGKSSWGTGDASKLVEPIKKQIEIINKKIEEIESKL